MFPMPLHATQVHLRPIFPYFLLMGVITVALESDLHMHPRVCRTIGICMCELTAVVLDRRCCSVRRDGCLSRRTAAGADSQRRSPRPGCHLGSVTPNLIPPIAVAAKHAPMTPFGWLNDLTTEGGPFE